MNEPIVHHHYHFGACVAPPSPTPYPAPQPQPARPLMPQSPQGLPPGVSKFRTQFDRGSFEVMQQVGMNFFPCAWVWSPMNEFGVETWIWVTNAPPLNANSIYLVPGDSASPPNLTWRIIQSGLPVDVPEDDFIAWAKTRVPGATLIGTRHTTVQTFIP